jgi:hypothetical protein
MAADAGGTTVLNAMATVITRDQRLVGFFVLFIFAKRNAACGYSDATGRWPAQEAGESGREAERSYLQ